MIGMVVGLSVQDGKQAEFEAVMGGLIAQVRANEPGCMLYSLCKKPGSATDYVMMEQYRSKADLDLHRKTDYFQAATPALGACLAGAPSFETYEVLI